MLDIKLDWKHTIGLIEVYLHLVCIILVSVFSIK